MRTHTVRRVVRVCAKHIVLVQVANGCTKEKCLPFITHRILIAPDTNITIKHTSIRLIVLPMDGGWKVGETQWASEPAAVYGVILISISISRVVAFYSEAIAYRLAQNILLPESRVSGDINSNAIIRKAPSRIGGCGLLYRKNADETSS